MVVCVWVVVQDMHREREERVGNILWKPLNHAECWVCSVYCHERQSISIPGENSYLVADFQCDLDLKHANPGPETASGSTAIRKAFKQSWTPRKYRKGTWQLQLGPMLGKLRFYSQICQETAM